MSLRDTIRVNTEYTRSINVERDAETSSVVGSYIPTSRAVLTLRQVADGFANSDRPRAWSLIGPYGSGKSSFALFLSALLGPSGSNGAELALRRLTDVDEDLAQEVRSHIGASKGYLRVLISGSPEPLARRIVIGLARSASKFWSQRRGRSPAVVARLDDLSRGETIPISEVVELVADLQDALARAQGRGILLVIDELGKFLEYEARHAEANDVFLLQALAERAYVKHRAPLQLFVLMHQAFEQYARGLSRSLRDDWAKVQGRFENIPFLEASEQTLRVVSAALDAKLTKNARSKVKRFAHEAADCLASLGALPTAMGKEVASSLFAQCYPLHPLTALILPQLCQKVAQNERTLFSYLGSQEPHGFQEWLASEAQLGDWVLPWQIYEYFILNQPAVLTDPTTHRRWAEVVTAAERLGDSEPEAARMLKTIGLLNLIGSRGGLKAAPEILRLCVASDELLRRALHELEVKSIVQFRKFSSEFRVWQGSDFDLDEAIELECRELGDFRLAEVLNNRARLEPVVARRYTIQTHTVRSFRPIFVDRESLRHVESLGNEPSLVFLLAEGQEDVRRITSTWLDCLPDTVVMAICHLGGQLRQALNESLALERIQASRPELTRDPVAARECRDRLEAALTAERKLISDVLGTPSESVWFRRSGDLQIRTARQLQEKLSDVLAELYWAAPIIRNELINRDAPSSTANAARNKLLTRLLTNSDAKDLDIDKFPAEKAMYRGLLGASGLHRKIGGQWRLGNPPRTDPCNFGPVWQRLEAFFEESESAPLPFTLLDDELVGVPYGVKRGVLPILYSVAFLTKQDDLALYEEGAYVPGLDSATLDRFLRRPESFSVQRFRLQGLRAKLFNQYARALYTDPSQADGLLSIARPLVKFAYGLEDYTKQTRVLSDQAKSVRAAVLHAKSPQKLIFEDLPQACGVPRANSASLKEDAYLDFADTLMGALRELKSAYPRLLQDQVQALAKGLALDASSGLSEIRKMVFGRYNGLDQFCFEADELGAFIRRLCGDDESDDLWLEKILLFLGRKPSAKWTDEDRATAQFRVAEFARRIRDLEKLRFAYDGAVRGAEDTKMILLRVVQQGEGDIETVVAMDSASAREAEKCAAEIAEHLAKLKDDRLRRVVLAKLTIRTLKSDSSEKDAEFRNQEPRKRRRSPEDA